MPYARTCVVFKCNEQYRKSLKRPISFFNFPNDQRLRKVWLRFVRLRRSTWKKTNKTIKNDKICSLHFDKKHILNYTKFEAGFSKCAILSKEAVPTIQVAASNSNQNSSQPSMRGLMRKRLVENVS